MKYDPLFFSGLREVTSSGSLNKSPHDAALSLTMKAECLFLWFYFTILRDTSMYCIECHTFSLVLCLMKSDMSVKEE